MSVLIRRATHDDKADLLRFHHALYINHFRKIASPSMREIFQQHAMNEALRSDMENMLRRPEHIVLVAIVTNEIAGYASGYTRTESDKALAKRGFVEDWFVHDEFRGRGIGGLLLTELENHFREQECQVVESATWAFNTKAIEQHRKYGYEDARIVFRKLL